MKKIISMISVFVFTLACGLVLSACGGTKPVSISASDAIATFKVGEAFETTGLKVTATYSDDTTKILENNEYSVENAVLKTDETVSVAIGSEFTTSGEYSVKITYKGKETSYDVTVSDRKYTIDDLDELSGKVQEYLQGIDKTFTVTSGDGEGVVKFQKYIGPNYVTQRFYFLNSVPLTEKFTNATFEQEIDGVTKSAKENEYYVEVNEYGVVYIIYYVDFGDKYNNWYERKAEFGTYDLTEDTWYTVISEGFDFLLNTFKLAQWDDVETDGTIVCGSGANQVKAKLTDGKLNLKMNNGFDIVISDVGTTQVELPNANLWG